MSNICAGIGRGQMTVLDSHVAEKTAIYNKYKKAFQNLPITMQPYEENTVPNHWLSAVTIDKGCDVSPFDIMDELSKHNVETRPLWKPMHMQPFYKDCDFFMHSDYAVSEDLFNRGLCLPSDMAPQMTEQELNEIIEIIGGMF